MKKKHVVLETDEDQVAMFLSFKESSRKNYFKDNLEVWVILSIITSAVQHTFCSNIESLRTFFHGSIHWHIVSFPAC